MLQAGVLLLVSAALQDVLQSRLAGALQQHQEAEERHHCKLKELARRWEPGSVAVTSGSELNGQQRLPVRGTEVDKAQPAEPLAMTCALQRNTLAPSG